jgi:hypothetical protein
MSLVFVEVSPHLIASLVALAAPVILPSSMISLSLSLSLHNNNHQIVSEMVLL